MPTNQLLAALRKQISSHYRAKHSDDVVMTSYVASNVASCIL